MLVSRIFPSLEAVLFLYHGGRRKKAIDLAPEMSKYHKSSAELPFAPRRRQSLSKISLYGKTRNRVWNYLCQSISQDLAVYLCVHLF
jgi:hypothetical protein